MALSSLSVVTNANRLRRFRPAPLAEADETSAEPVVEVGSAAPVPAVDPVCGMSVEKATAKYRSSRDGVEYHFCSEGCKQTFDANPERYAAAAGSHNVHHG
jgi:Cu+-exporting ATPase